MLPDHSGQERGFPAGGRLSQIKREEEWSGESCRPIRPGGGGTPRGGQQGDLWPGRGQLGSWETPWSCEEAGGLCCSLCWDLSRDRSQIPGTDLLRVWVLSG